MKAAEIFFSGVAGGAWSDGRELDKDEQGWVRSLEADQVARTIIISNNDAQGEAIPNYPTGDYVILYEGEGTMDYSLGGAEVVSQSPGRDVVRVEEGDSLYLYITAVEPANYLRNIRAILPGGRCENDEFQYCRTDADCGTSTCTTFESNYQDEIFHPDFLNEMRHFKTIRFMDWMETNREVGAEDGVEEPEPVYNFAEYPAIDSAHWHPTPPEVMVELANKLNADPWFNMPHTATDALVTEFAQYIRDNLNPGLKAYVEYSNETWNSIFDQAPYIQREGCLLFSPDAEGECHLRESDTELCQSGPWVPDPVGGGGPSSFLCLQYGWHYMSYRTAQIMQIWEQVYAENGMSREDYLIRVMGGQFTATRSLTPALLDFTGTATHSMPDGQPARNFVDAYAIAPYFGGDYTPPSVDAAFEAVEEETNAAPIGTLRLLAGTPGETPVDNNGDGTPDSFPGATTPNYGWMTSDVTTFNNNPDWQSIDLIAYEGGQHLFSYDTTLMERMTDINRDQRMYEVYTQYLEHWYNLTGGNMFAVYSSPGSYTQYGTWGSKEYQGQAIQDAPKHRAMEDFIERHRGD